MAADELKEEYPDRKVVVVDTLCASAGQGLVAGINAARKLTGKEPIVLDRSQAYIGVLIDDLVTKESLVLLVTPIDGSAPKGRLILPQVQTIRAALDSHAVCVAVQPEELGFMLSQLKKEPQLVITDSQAFGRIKDIVPENVPLTSFSILMARYKGTLQKSIDAIGSLKELKDGDTVLISEGCTHHRQCGDIGREKIPAALRKISGRELIFEFSSGNSFPDDISRYAAVVHCGGCMLNEREVRHRAAKTTAQGVPITNYGTMIAYVHGILKRSLSIFPEMAETL